MINKGNNEREKSAEKQQGSTSLDYQILLINRRVFPENSIGKITK